MTKPKKGRPKTGNRGRKPSPAEVPEGTAPPAETTPPAPPASPTTPSPPPPLPSAPSAPPALTARRLRDTPARRAAQSNKKKSLPSSGELAPQNEEQVSPEQRELIDVTNDISGEDLPPLSDGHRRDSPAPRGPLRIPLGHSDPSSSSSSSSAPPMRTRLEGARPTGDEKEEKYSYLQSPPSYKGDAGGKSALEHLI